MPSFNLVTKPWIPVRIQGGKLTEVSLQDALLQARNYWRIEDPSPLVVAALHRFLLAALHRTLKGPTHVGQAAQWMREQGFPDAVRIYLEKWKHRFDLFDKEQPFYQVPDFSLELSSRSWTVLAAELNSDNNKVLFDHTDTKKPPALRPAEAARLLIANQTFALSAGKSVLTHTATAPIATAALVLVMGENLLETLCLNMVSQTTAVWEADKPVWELDAPKVAQMMEGLKSAATGPVQRYTWLSRSVRLEPEEEDGKTVVRWIAYASGVRYEDDKHDAMVAYRKDEKKGYLPFRFQEGKAFWRDYAALLPHKKDKTSDVVPGVVNHALEVYRSLGKRNQPIRTAVFGQVNDQAKIELWRSEVFNLPAALLEDREVFEIVQEMLLTAEETGRQLRSAGWSLAAKLLTVSERQPHKDDVNGLVQSFPLQAVYWSCLEGDFTTFVNLLVPDFDEDDVKAFWLKAVRDAANQAWRATVQSVGNNGRALRAVVEARNRLDVHLAGMFKRIKELEPKKEAV